MAEHATFIDEGQASAALEALGFSRSPDDTEKRGREFLIGSLLAAIEGAAWQDIDRADLDQVHAGYMRVLPAHAGMIRTGGGAVLPAGGAPRARGDDPPGVCGVPGLLRCSPRTRG